MLNPLRSEAEAYRFLLLSIGYFAAIVLASVLGGTWWGLGVFALLTALVLWRILLGRRDAQRPVPTAPGRRGGTDERRILVVANETVGGRVLREEILRLGEGYRTEVLVVVPALAPPVKHWLSDVDEARRAAQERLDASLARLAEAGVRARGEIGDGEPLQAIEDAMRTFGADELIVSTHPRGRSHWLERGVVEAARERFALPITHVVVDLAAEREEVRGPTSAP